MKPPEKKSFISTEIRIEKFLWARLHTNGVIEINWDNSVKTIEVEHLKKMQEAVRQIGDGKKMPLLFSVPDFIHINKEAMKYATSEDCIRYTLAIAVLVDVFSKKLLLNFFVRFNKPIIPTKGFSTKEAAFNWLENELLEKGSDQSF